MHTYAAHRKLSRRNANMETDKSSIEKSGTTEKERLHMV